MTQIHRQCRSIPPGVRRSFHMYRHCIQLLRCTCKIIDIVTMSQMKLRLFAEPDLPLMPLAQRSHRCCKTKIVHVWDSVSTISSTLSQFLLTVGNGTWRIFIRHALSFGYFFSWDGWNKIQFYRNLSKNVFANCNTVAASGFITLHSKPKLIHEFRWKSLLEHERILAASSVSAACCMIYTANPEFTNMKYLYINSLLDCNASTLQTNTNRIITSRNSDRKFLQLRKRCRISRTRFLGNTQLNAILPNHRKLAVFCWVFQSTIKCAVSIYIEKWNIFEFRTQCGLFTTHKKRVWKPQMCQCCDFVRFDCIYVLAISRAVEMRTSPLFADENSSRFHVWLRSFRPKG